MNHLKHFTKTQANEVLMITGALRKMLKHRTPPKYCFKNLALSAASDISTISILRKAQDRSMRLETKNNSK